MPVTIQMTVRQLPGWLKNLTRQYPEAMRKGLRRAAHRGQRHIVSVAIPNAKPYPPDNLGMYRKSWKVENTPTGAILGSDAPYAGVIELGRRPGGGGPPLDKIREWVYRKFRVSRKLAAGRPGRRAVGEKAAARWAAKRQEVEKIALAIFWKIRKKGIAPRNVMRGSQSEFARFAQEEVQLAMNDVTGL